VNLLQSIMTLAAVLVVGVLPALAETGPSVAPSLTPEENVFPIGCFPGPPAEANTLANWRSIRDANFTVACPVYRYDQQANLTMLDHCRDLGLKAVVNVKLIPATADNPLPHDWRRQVEETVVTYAGKPQRLYEPVRRLNSEILQLGRTLLRLESTDVFHTGATIPQGCRRLPEGLLLSVSQDLPLVVGFFRDTSDGRYVMVVSRDCQQSVSVDLRFSRNVEAVSRISAQNGLTSAIAIDKGRATIDLQPGSGVLLHLDPEDRD